MTKQEVIEQLQMPTCEMCKFYEGEDCDNCYIGIAIECIEKQIPRKPIEKESHYPNHLVLSCPNCSHSFGAYASYSRIDKELIYKSSTLNRFCPNCGTCMDWSDDDEVN